MMKKIFFLAIFVGAVVTVFSQEENEQKINKPKRDLDLSVGLGIGLTNFFGDVVDINETNVHLLGNRKAYELNVKANLSKSFSFGLGALYGKLSGNENFGSDHENFEADLISGGINIEYNFYGIYKKRVPMLTPFLGAGAYYTSVKDIRTDLGNKNGETYYYWSDDKIRNQAELPENRYTAVKIARDYDYETSINAGPINTFSVPVYAGLDFHLSKMFTFRLSTKYFFTFSDKLDNHVAEQNDGFLFNSIGLFVNLTPNRDELAVGDMAEVYLSDFRKIEKEDEDSDGVRDINDKCAHTPFGVEVNKHGCPLDLDNDGIADHEDDEPNTQPGLVINIKGVELDYEAIEKGLGDSLGIDHALLEKNTYLYEGVKNKKYTVSLGSVDKFVPDSIMLKLEQIPGVNKFVLEDGTIVYTLGSYEDFVDASNTKQSLQRQGISSAYEVSEDQANRVASELDNMDVETEEAKETNKSMMVDLANGDKIGTAQVKKENPDIIKFKVEIMVFEPWVNQEKAAYIMAREGVEIRKAYTVNAKIYTIGAFNTEEEAELLKKELIPLGVKEAYILATINNERIDLTQARELLKKKGK